MNALRSARPLCHSKNGFGAGGTMRRIALLVSVLIVLLSCGVNADAAEERVVRVYNWSDYIDDSIIRDFERETGVRVVYDVYDSNDILETKLLAGRSGYDLVFPSGNCL